MGNWAETRRAFPLQWWYNQSYHAHGGEDAVDFIRDHIEGLFGALVLTVFVIKLALVLKKAHRIDREGIETDATVVRIEESTDAEGSVTYESIVRYRDDLGTVRESPMAFTGFQEHAVGDAVRIRYIPGEFDLVREVRD